MEASELSTPLVVVAVVGLAAFLVFKLVQGAKQKAAERRTALRLLGFEPVADPARDAEKLIDLCRRGKGDRFRVENLLERRGSDPRILLFDLADTQDDGDRQGLLVVTSPLLALPRFQLIPRIDSGGRIADFANRLLEKLVTREGRAVSFPEDSGFSRRYTVAGPDEEEIRRFFDGERLGALAEMEGLMVEAAAGSFSIDRLRIGGTGLRTDVDDISERVEQAERLFRLFSRRG